MWDYDEGKYDRVDRIKRCWKNSNILPMSWECDINNYFGNSYVPISMNNLNTYYYDNIFHLLEKISVKAKEQGINVSREACGFKGSLSSDCSLKKS